MTRPSARILTVFVVAAMLAAGILVAPPVQATGSNILTIGNVTLGINNEGHLNVPGTIPSAETGTTTVGLRHAPTNLASTEPGCHCEGWGVAEATSGTSASANQNFSPQVANMQLVSSVLTAGVSFVSVVDVPSTASAIMRVTHDYHASASSDLIECDVTVQNVSGSPIDLRYRRVMDWDTEPTAFNEYVTIQGTAAAANVLFASNDGFQTANPLGPQTNIGGFTGDFVDAFPSTFGTHDHGALFDFGFGMLAPGATQTFQIFYGASSTEVGALAALAAVGAEVYSLGQNSTPTGQTIGDPATFIFAFKGVGGVSLGFDTCIQDNRSGNVLRWNSATGEYQFVWADTGTVASGQGTIRHDGRCITYVEDFSAGHFVRGRINTCTNRGNGTVRVPEIPGRTFNINDTNTTNNDCGIGSPAKTRSAWAKSPRVSYSAQACPAR
jgi:hypothetical protein